MARLLIEMAPYGGGGSRPSAGATASMGVRPSEFVGRRPVPLLHSLHRRRPTYLCLSISISSTALTLIESSLPQHFAASKLAFCLQGILLESPLPE